MFRIMEPMHIIYTFSGHARLDDSRRRGGGAEGGGEGGGGGADWLWVAAVRRLWQKDTQQIPSQGKENLLKIIGTVNVKPKQMFILCVHWIMVGNLDKLYGIIGVMKYLVPWILIFQEYLCS